MRELTLKLSELEAADFAVGRTRHSEIKRLDEKCAEPLASIENHWSVAPSWRFGGRTPDPSSAANRLRSPSLLVRTVCPPGALAEDVPFEGLIVLYDVSAYHGHAWLAVAGTGHPMVIEATAAFISSLFGQTAIRMLLLDMVGVTHDRLRSLFGTWLELAAEIPEHRFHAGEWRSRCIARLTRSAYDADWRDKVEPIAN